MSWVCEYRLLMEIMITNVAQLQRQSANERIHTY